MLSGVLKTVKTNIRKIQHNADIQRLKATPVNLENIKQVHISLDDVQQLFIDAKELGLTSLFATPLITELERLHEQYGAKFSLYCFDDPAYRLNRSYCSELKANEDWLRIGYHADRDGAVTLNGYSGFTEYYKTAGITAASSLRLHYFDCPEELKAVMRVEGVQQLLCADDGRDSYGLSGKIYRGGYSEDGMTYLPTDIRLEHNVTRLIKRQDIQDKEELIIFGHETPFMKYREYEKLEAILRMLPDTAEYEL